jgi:hypothetical protein
VIDPPAVEKRAASASEPFARGEANSTIRAFRCLHWKCVVSNAKRQSVAETRYPLANPAGWDNEPRIVLHEEAGMTLTYAVIADGGIVLCADSQVTHTHQERGRVIGTYEGRQGKIRRFGGDRFAFSMAGNSGFLDALLAQVDPKVESRSFEECVWGYRTAFLKYRREKYPDGHPFPDAVFLFCGYAETESGKVLPELAKLDVANDFMWNPIIGTGSAASGSTEHGAMYYLHHRFYREGMPLEQAKLLAYCAVAEVADQDNSVGGPIEMEVITTEGSGPMTDIDKYERARQELIGQTRFLLTAFR